MIAVVIPSYRVKKHILALIPRIGSEVAKIYVVDDKCPEESGRYVEANCTDSRVKVLYNEVNQGVGGAVKTGYRQALADGAQVVVKLDGDGQMDPQLIPGLVAPILRREADYCKGNRFFFPDSLTAMPRLRLLGNSVLSLVNKFVNGYWGIMDPTNGFTAIHAVALGLLPLDKIQNRYFFESDMLFRLSTVRAVVKDYAMHAHYADEESSLKIRRVLLEFPPKYISRFFKRIFYNYFLRDFNAATVSIVAGSTLLAFGVILGVVKWVYYARMGVTAPGGTVMLAALGVILGIQFLLSAWSYDIQHQPKEPLCNQLSVNE